MNRERQQLKQTQEKLAATKQELDATNQKLAAAEQQLAEVAGARDELKRQVDTRSTDRGQVAAQLSPAETKSGKSNRLI